MEPRLLAAPLALDVDGVIVAPSRTGGGSAHLERDLGLPVSQLQQHFFRPHFEDVLHGRAPLHERLAPVLARIAPHLRPQQLVDYWFAHDAHLNHGLLDQLAALRSQGLALHLATVQEHLRAHYLWHTLGLRERFDALHYAADLGWAKPADGFFAAIEQRTGYRGDELFFIDDKDANVQAARARGWHAAVWTGGQSLASLMADAGV